MQFSDNVLSIIAEKTIETQYKLLDWIDSSKINWYIVPFENPSRAAIHLFEANPESHSWWLLSAVPAAIDLLKANPDKIDWEMLSENPAAIHLLEEHIDKIDWVRLSRNPAPAAINLLEEHYNKID